MMGFTPFCEYSGNIPLIHNYRGLAGSFQFALFLLNRKTIIFKRIIIIIIAVSYELITFNYPKKLKMLFDIVSSTPISYIFP